MYLRSGKVKAANISVVRIFEDYTWIIGLDGQTLYQGDGYVEAVELWKVILGDVKVEKTAPD